ncbi:helix-turn-helix transcriptional regulator [Stakelama tenebrarum]|uniref:Helix-turn-helix transcriptional regulator n=1 Tax=Stakelama tenebrarum TaxID=2711215 RepID=A0A6G6Y8M7_9SPHN|nr:helix-turn-helix transcriptional regulator [Sphingosinithalassobacter tenebrarum]QIG81068.1 helix-turn-helix transcriptional regulator [Sphingosinithalassobacter tenebrarum]
MPAATAPQASIRALAQQVRKAGSRIGLPLVAACADISSARPALDEEGTPVGALFDFTRGAREYWEWSDLALHNAIIAVVRHTAEPFYFDRGTIGAWQAISLREDVEKQARQRDYDVRAAIVAPAHLPGPTIGAVLWASDGEGVDVAALYRDHAVALHGLALRFVAACDRASHGMPDIGFHRLTRREIQCLKLAAAGKTDGEIATILEVAVPTVRFHLRKASAKLGQTGRLRTVQRAAELGFVTTRQ